MRQEGAKKNISTAPQTSRQGYDAYVAWYKGRESLHLRNHDQDGLFALYFAYGRRPMSYFRWNTRRFLADPIGSIASVTTKLIQRRG